MQKRLFIVSNRLPVTVEDTADATLERSGGGLVTAMKSFLRQNADAGVHQTENYWVGVPGCSGAVWQKVEKNAYDEDFSYIPLFPNKKTYDSYYNGMSNSVIWPLFHYFPSYAEFNPGYFESYEAVNEMFFETLRKHLHPGDTVWIHDYHLLPLAQMLREAYPDLTIGFFLHIPFPSYEIFRIMPKKWQERLLTGILGADLIGFHTIDYASHFLKCVQMILGIENDMHVLRYDNRLIKVDVFPISIDYEKLNGAYDNPEVAAIRNEFREKFGDKKIIFSADRLDYTKGVSNRLKAYEYFLKNNPEYLGKVVFVLIVVPSRDTISKYAQRKKLIDEYIGDINSRIGNIHWQPIIYQYDNLDFEHLTAMYSLCDLALITPLRDGMNLVSKEFVAVRKDLQGVLILSEMTGAARELTDALIINPNDAEDIASKIKEGLEMPASEQKDRLIAMRERISGYDITAWAQDFMSRLDFIKQKQSEYEVKFFDIEAKNQLMQDYAMAGKRLFLLDYDGTLVPFSSVPALAEPSEALKDLLTILAKDQRNTVYIISGRDSQTLERWLGHLPINIISEHGAKFKFKEGEWENVITASASWKKHIKPILETYVKRCAHTFIEMKDYSMAWHYRNANPEQAKLRAAELHAELSEQIHNHDLHILNGNKVIEVRNSGIDKGTAIQRVLSKGDYDFILSFGDDRTDEDMFKILAEDKRAYTIKVGTDASFAKYNLHTSYMVISMLETIANAGVTVPGISQN